MRNLTDTSIQYIKGVGPSRKKIFFRLGVETVEDLMYLFPRRYEDRRQMTPLSAVRPGEFQTVAGRVFMRAGRKSWHTKKHVLELVVRDGRSQLTAVWFNQPYMEQYFRQGQRVVLFGKVDVYRDRLQMVAPEYEIIEEDEAESLSVGRIVPIYPLTRGITQRTLRKTVKNALDKYLSHLTDPLPYDLRRRHRLMNLALSLRNIHFPETDEVHKEAYRRIAFEEFFLFQISIILRRMSIVQKPGVAHRVPPAFLDEFAAGLPFSLTGAQRRAVAEILEDMRRPHPMHRLLQGDVGSGKTLVALAGCLAAVRAGGQAAVMAPTEILARQHYENIKKTVNPEILKSSNPIRLALLLGGTPKKEREAIYAGIRDGSINFIIGTHALIQEDVEFKRLSFVVIDEQHKFGVRQRALLPDKGTNPDTLIMTATPIPRTLSLTLFGDLDVSTLDEMPVGRGKVSTRLFSEEDASSAYARVRELAAVGRQAYIVYPIIEESDRLALKAAKKMFRRFQKTEFKGLRLGLLHGQMKQAEARDVMNEFKQGEIDILVATTVLEVGVDVPNASVMLIEHADRFGLAQLHQLRGRVGRGRQDAECLLVASPTTPEARMRLDAILATTDGFKIAQQDLMIRGAGEFFGRHQHGLNELRIADPATQMDILEDARKEAMALVEQDPRLEKTENRLVRAFIEKRYPSYLDMVKGG